MSHLSLYTKFETLPPELKSEVSDFIDFLVAKTTKNKKRIIPQFGSVKGKIKMAKDFDEPLDDFNEYM